MLQPSDHSQFAKAGYVIVRQAVPAATIDELADTLLRAFRRFHPDAPPFRGRVFDDPDFHVAMRRFRTERPREFGLMFDTVQTSVALWRFGTAPALTQIAAELMDDAPSGLSVSDLLLRMDAPQDVRNKLAWHQDSSYFRQNARGEHGCVCSVALRDVAVENGALEILPGSHALGRIEVAKTGGDDAISSEQFRVPEAYTAHGVPVALPLATGDAIFLNFDLIHRSGTNVTPSFRFTAITRFHRMFTPDFVPGRLVYTPSKTLPAATTARPTPAPLRREPPAPIAPTL